MSALCCPAMRGNTVPVTRTTSSGPSRRASSSASAGDQPGSNDTCTSPSRSRRSRNTSEPRSRRRCTQPARVTAVAGVARAERAGGRGAVRGGGTRGSWRIRLRARRAETGGAPPRGAACTDAKRDAGQHPQGVGHPVQHGSELRLRNEHLVHLVAGAVERAERRGQQHAAPPRPSARASSTPPTSVRAVVLPPCPTPAPSGPGGRRGCDERAKIAAAQSSGGPQRAKRLTPLRLGLGHHGHELRRALRGGQPRAVCRAAPGARCATAPSRAPGRALGPHQQEEEAHRRAVQRVEVHGLAATPAAMASPPALSDLPCGMATPLADAGGAAPPRARRTAAAWRPRRPPRPRRAAPPTSSSSTASLDRPARGTRTRSALSSSVSSTRNRRGSEPRKRSGHAQGRGRCGPCKPNVRPVPHQARIGTVSPRR
jgi:hypothetical protein